MKKAKDEEIKVRVTSATKSAVMALAAERGESESVIVREALKAYLAKMARDSSKSPEEADRLAREEVGQEHQRRSRD